MKNIKRAAVVLSGCGNRDGTEITEAVSILIALFVGKKRARDEAAIEAAEADPS